MPQHIQAECNEADGSHNQEHDEPSHRQDEDEDSVDEVRPPILHEEDMLACGRGDEEEKTTQVSSSSFSEES